MTSNQASTDPSEFNVIKASEPPSEDLSARRSDLAKKYRTDHAEPLDDNEDHIEQISVPDELRKDEKSELGSILPHDKTRSRGTILEAAFVDPGCFWPSVEGQGRNAIELQASVKLIDEGNDDDSLVTTQSQMQRMSMPEKPLAVKTTTTVIKSRGICGCCKKTSSVDAIETDEEQLRAFEEKKLAVQELRRLHADEKREKLKSKEKAYRIKHKYNRVPEGILIYRLDTSTGLLELVSQPHSQTDMETLVTEMQVVEAHPSKEKSRRGLDLVGPDGTRVTLIACEQRTATAWLEALSMMHAKGKGMVKRVSYLTIFLILFV